jgi:hypothetical protein
MNDFMQIFLNAAFVNNFVLALFLGICPFLGVSAKTETAVRMGGAVSFVMLVSSVCAFGIHQLLVWINAPYWHPPTPGLDQRPLPATDFLYRGHRLGGATGGDDHQEIQSGAVSGAGHFPAADHHQLRHPRGGPVPDQPGV